MSVPTLLISGTTGVGKSTVAAEINDQLAAREIPNAAVDLDALVWQWPSTTAWNVDLMFENLASIWPNYRAHGATHLVLARVQKDRAEFGSISSRNPRRGHHGLSIGCARSDTNREAPRSNATRVLTRLASRKDEGA